MSDSFCVTKQQQQKEDISEKKLFVFRYGIVVIFCLWVSEWVSEYVILAFYIFSYLNGYKDGIMKIYEKSFLNGLVIEKF